MNELVTHIDNLAHSITLDDNTDLAKIIGDIRRAQEQGEVSNNVVVLPGLCDVHVHLREPGQTYKETIATGTLAAARGGFTTVGAMPNLDPVPDTKENLALEQDAIGCDALIETIPYASVTKNETGQELSDIVELAPYVIGFSDDGHGVDNPELMKQALRLLAQSNSIVAVHAEAGELRPAGSCINDGPFAREHNLIGIPKTAEYVQIERDLNMLRELKAEGYLPAYHVCHISCGESAQLIREARAEGLNVTCETAMHYLLVDESMIEDNGRFKMNPPLRQPADRQALIEALIDGTVDMIATDHAPHSAEEKAHGLVGSAFGVVGLEISFPLFYTYFVKTGKVSLERAVELFTTAGRKRFNIPARTTDWTIWDLDADYTVNPDDFLSLGRATPFAQWEISGRCLATIYDGNLVYNGLATQAQ
ncbi:dihydroorotase [Arcanobacterium phocisimile]|uniref:Dihydroorotase n=1 Tax=Arcanobacterium phocisimile TaxID=1302235 RepID=A0ABX7IET4_9ACTO|nr:dihydroorotase [Arcanobacterium phocisimile]QRV01522.1 dihydroorotase [Arcanobacterium phocisimile]